MSECAIPCLFDYFLYNCTSSAALHERAGRVIVLRMSKRGNICDAAYMHEMHATCALMFSVLVRLKPRVRCEPPSLRPPPNKTKPNRGDGAERPLESDEQPENPPQAERRKSSLSELGSKLTSLILPLKTLVQRPPPPNPPLPPSCRRRHHQPECSTTSCRSRRKSSSLGASGPVHFARGRWRFAVKLKVPCWTSGVVKTPSADFDLDFFFLIRALANRIFSPLFAAPCKNKKRF